jgi:hypothetical protein
MRHWSRRLRTGVRTRLEQEVAEVTESEIETVIDMSRKWCANNDLSEWGVMKSGTGVKARLEQEVAEVTERQREIQTDRER